MGARVTSSHHECAPPEARRELIAGGVLIGLGFVAEVSGAAIAVTCTSGEWCSRGFALTLGQPSGGNRYSLISTGPSSAYLGGRIVAAPFLISGFTLTMVGLGASAPPSTWARRRPVGWSLLGAGIGVLAVSRILRVVLLSTGGCQEPLCVHGFDQTSLWIGRGLTFAGGGLLIRDSREGARVRVGPGPSDTYGLSLAGRF